jgi:transposase-like protein
MEFSAIDFGDEEACFEKLFELVRPEGLHCPRCGARNGIHVYRHHRKSWILDYRCSHCRRTFNAWIRTPLEGTHHSPTELWRVIKGMTEGKSTVQLAKELHCQRPGLSRFRSQLLRWVTNNFHQTPKVRRHGQRNLP